MSGSVRLIWLALSALVLAACFDVETRLSLNAHGSGTLAVTLRADPIFASAPQRPPRIFDEVEGELTVRSEIVGSQYVHQEQIVFPEIAALAKHGIRLERIAGGTTIRFVQVVEKPTPQQRQKLELVRSLLVGRYFTSVVELPGRIVDASPLVLENGDAVRPEVVDRTVTWRMPLMALIDARTTELTIDYEAPSPRRQPEPTVVAEVRAPPPELKGVAQPPATGPRRPAYPILFLHGVASDASTWDELKVHLEGELGWTFGGRLAIMPYDGVTCTFERPCAGFWGRGARGDFYTANFAEARANYANGKGIIQQGREVGAFLARLRELFGDAQHFIIIAHSIGGLAARSYLAELDTTYFGDVAELITYGTPHNGSPFGFLLDSSAVARWLAARLRLHIRKDDQGVRDMTPGASDFLPRLYRARLRDDVRYTAIVSTVDCREPVPGYAWPSAVALILFDLLGPSDCVVAADSQNLRIAMGVPVEQRQKVTLRLSNRPHVTVRGIPDRSRLPALDPPSPAMRLHERLDQGLVSTWLRRRHRRSLRCHDQLPAAPAPQPYRDADGQSVDLETRALGHYSAASSNSSDAARAGASWLASSATRLRIPAACNVTEMPSGATSIRSINRRRTRACSAG